MDKTGLRDDIRIKTPDIHPTAFIADGAKVIGDIILKKNSSIWYNTVVRADINSIVIGERSNIQDNSVIHLENDQGVIVGNDVTVGHNVILHGCKVGDGVLVGMGAVIMNGVDIGKGSSCHVGYRSCFYRSVPLGKIKNVKKIKMKFKENKKIFDPKKIYKNEKNPTKL